MRQDRLAVEVIVAVTIGVILALLMSGCKENPLAPSATEGGMAGISLREAAAAVASTVRPEPIEFTGSTSYIWPYDITTAVVEIQGQTGGGRRRLAQ